MTDIQVLYEGPIVKRSEAKAEGLKYYFTGKPCKRGHVDKRFVNNSACFQCIIIYRNNNRDNARECTRIHYQKNKESKREYGRNYSREYYIQNSDDIKKYQKDYRGKNPDKIRVRNENRRARMQESEGTYGVDDVSRMLGNQNNKCAEPTCKADLSDGYHVDHIMPLALGGSNWPSNLQCLCPTCNLKKSAKHPLDWAKEKGRLV